MSENGYRNKIAHIQRQCGTHTDLWARWALFVKWEMLVYYQKGEL